MSTPKAKLALKPSSNPGFSWAEMDAIIADRRAPPGSFTVRDFAIHCGKSLTTSRNELAALVSQGLLGSGAFTTDRSGGWTMFYWILKNRRKGSHAKTR